MHPVRLPVQHLGVCRYSCVFVPCQSGASTLNIAILFFREPQKNPSMQLVKREDTILSADDLALRAAMFVEAFEQDIALSAPLNVSLSFHLNPSTRLAEGVNQMHPPVLSESDNHRIMIHLNIPNLVGIPTLALQGWLDYELAAIIIQRQHTLYRYNFKRDILPLFQVSGMAAQFIRYLVSHLEDCLKRALRTDMILEMEHGLSLAYYYYLMTVPSAEEKQSYHKLVPHKWTRAIFICKKSKEFVPIALLDAGGYLPTLTSFWWRCHAYLLPEDRKLMQKLAAVFLSNRHHRFSDQMVAAFEAIKSDLL
jgi:hypothetical protein